MYSHLKGDDITEKKAKGTKICFTKITQIKQIWKWNGNCTEQYIAKDIAKEYETFLNENMIRPKTPQQFKIDKHNLSTLKINKIVLKISNNK